MALLSKNFPPIERCWKRPWLLKYQSKKCEGKEFWETKYVSFHNVFGVFVPSKWFQRTKKINCFSLALFLWRKIDDWAIDWKIQGFSLKKTIRTTRTSESNSYLARLAYPDSDTNDITPDKKLNSLFKQKCFGLGLPEEELCR